MDKLWPDVLPYAGVDDPKFIRRAHQWDEMLALHKLYNIDTDEAARFCRDFWTTMAFIDSPEASAVLPSLQAH